MLEALGARILPVRGRLEGTAPRFSGSASSAESCSIRDMTGLVGFFV
ncbi:hypothetical protein [Arthrobacter ulcerisalmonis]